MQYDELLLFENSRVRPFALDWTIDSGFAHAGIDTLLLWRVGGLDIESGWVR